MGLFDGDSEGGFFGGSNSIFNNPFGVGDNSVSGAAGRALEGFTKGVTSKDLTGFNKKDLASFQLATSSLASSKKRVDSGTIAPTLKTETVSKLIPVTGLDMGVSQDQVKGFINAFNLRQDEVFGRRAQPGISQTRLA